MYFIIGGKNPNWKKNEEFASKIHQVLEEKHPGVSKGIHAKEASEGNGLYNQNISPNSILIEVGGPYNTLEECYRTTDWLAEAISEVILNAKKVDAPVTPKKS
ncbi:Stage II sporulation protein P (SpoIIP) [compost metagenome]